MSQKYEYVPIEGTERPANDEEIFLLKTMAEAPKNNLEIYNLVLRQLLTIIVSLMGGSVIFLDKSKLPVWSLVCSMAFLFGAFIATFAGVLPRNLDAYPNEPYDIKKALLQATNFKSMMLWIAYMLLFVGFGFAMLGLLLPVAPVTK